MTASEDLPNGLVTVEDVDMHDPDSDNDLPEAAGPNTTSEKRRAQNARFASWLAREVEAGINEQTREVLKGTADEELSMRNLMAKQESNIIVKSPREYQLELFERAKTENTIAVLDTGSGKTLIAVLLLRHTIDQELEDRTRGKPPRIAIFLVDSVALVFQQFAVLECNLDHKVERFCGAMGCDLWTKDVWAKHFEACKVIVCTAEVLVQCLMHSFITMEQINLLIFDEAHHAKQNHPYARLIKDYYLAVTDDTKRPRIFGMTASPVDAKTDVAQAAKELETLLHSRIATTSDMTLLAKSIKRPDEEVAIYGPLRAPFETDLHKKLRARFGDNKVFSQLFERSLNLSAEMGTWCADYYWTFALADEKARKFETRIERRFHATRQGRSISLLDVEIAQLRDAINFIKDVDFGAPQADSTDLSHKVLKLHEWLSRFFERPSEHRCIVFVERRHTARLLHRVFGTIGGPNLRSSVLIGSRSGGLDDVRFSCREQVLTLIKFRKGELNCLFATSVAEEGLDVPDCNLVVRFDLYQTMIQYIQSRGRARHHHSKYLHMVEHNNAVHVQVVRQVRQSENIMRQFCQTLPADRLLLRNDEDLERALAKECRLRTYKEASTGAKLTYHSSLVVLAHFVGSLPLDYETEPQTNYIMSFLGGKFVCEVILPENSPVRAAVGLAYSRKSLAKRSAAFEACILLRKGRYLDANLLPVYTKQLPAMRNALLALNMNKSNSYPMRVKPALWEQTRGTIPNTLHVTLLNVSNGLDRPHRPLALLTRTRLPQFPTFPLFLDSGKVSYLTAWSCDEDLDISEELLESLTSFTLRVFNDVFAKTYERDIPRMSYWLAPVTLNVLDASASGSIASIIDWTTIAKVHATEEHKWTPDMSDRSLEDRFLIDPWSGGRRWFSKHVCSELNPSDPVPRGTASGPDKHSIIAHTTSNIYKGSRAKFAWNPDQPVLEAELVPQRRNMLTVATEKEKTSKTKSFLCPEPLRISVLPTDIVAMCYVLPAVVHRMESYLIVKEMCSVLDVDAELSLALEAMTKDSDNTSDHQETARINFQSGMGKNYERLEFMGDCFLKMATSISLFGLYAKDDEYDFHVKRMLLICNQNLFNHAKELKVYEYVRSQAFSRRTWYPEGLKLKKGKGANTPGGQSDKHRLGDKTVADVCEALIGASFVSYNRPGEWEPEHWESAIKAVTKLVSSPDHQMLRWNDYREIYQKPAYQTAEATASQKDLAEKVELIHPYHFRYPRLLRSAFCHPSYPFLWEKVPSYQRLEFLGDSLLDMACITYLFYKFPDRDPQWLTEHKMAMVSNKFLGAACAKLGFHRHLRHSSSIIEYQIREYTTELEEAAKLHGARDYWTTVRDPPKCLPDIVEAYVAAIFIDSDFDYNEVQRFFDTHIRWFFEDMSIYDTFANNHPVTRLHTVMETHFGCHDYRLMAQEIPALDGTPVQVVAAIMIHNGIVTSARGPSGRFAKVRAATSALDEVQSLAPFEYRAKYGCDCHLRRGSRDASAIGKGESLDTAI
ncbi:Dicer-like protein 1 [Elasticomyces elasticus]|nr:Dicer-like protein 1 [Elasticomyces elasticus]